MPDAAVPSQLDGSLQWEHMYAGDVQHDWTERMVVVQGHKWAI